MNAAIHIPFFELCYKPKIVASKIVWAKENRDGIFESQKTQNSSAGIEKISESATALILMVRFSLTFAPT